MASDVDLSVDSVDVVIVGLGPGAESVATQLAGAGLEVVAVDRHLVGGECPYYGCVPTKMMIRAADALAEARRVPALAGDVDLSASWEPVAKRVAEEATADWDDTIAVERLEAAGVTFVRGHGRLAGPRVVEVDGRRLTARRGVVLNTGTDPAVPPVDGLAGTPYWTNRDAVRATQVPGSLAVIGGGAIGVELSQVFARFGAQVTVLEVADRLLPPEEPESGALVAGVLRGEGIRVLTGADIRSVRYDEGQFTLDVAGAPVRAEKLLVAAGRRPNLDDIGLDTVGLDPSAKVLDTDEWLRAGEGLWAMGDITGKGAFTHVAMYQAQVLVRSVLEQGGPPASYHAVPRVTFTDPEVGAVGMTERQAGEAGIDVAVGMARVPETARGWIHKAGNEGFIKVVCDASRGVLVGATAAGPAGGEVLSMLTTAVHAAVPVDTLRQMIYAYPTFHRGVEDALRDLA